MIYKIRVYLETNNGNVFRDIEIQGNAVLEDLHNVIMQSFDFEGTELAAFYLTDEELNQGMEIPLFNLDDSNPANNMMSDTQIKEVLDENNPKLIYIYDFLSLWRFLIELMEIAEEENATTYPNVVYAEGIRPESAPDVEFGTDEFDDPFGDEDTPFDEFQDYDDNQWY